MPAKSTKPAQAPQPAAKRRAHARRATSTRRRGQPGHSEIAERAYFIHLEEGSPDEVANWLRAERELMPA